MSDRGLVVLAGQKLAFQIRFWLWVSLASCTVNGLVSLPTWAQAVTSATAADEEQSELSHLRADQENLSAAERPAAVPEIPQSESEPPAITVTDWLAQIEASLTQVVGVRVEATAAGLQVVLETAEGELTAPTTQMLGNALIADIPNAVLGLPGGDEFFQAEPIVGIALVEVTQLPGDRVRVAITGTDAPPTAEVRSDGRNLVLSVATGTIAAEDEEAIEIVVTGDQDEGYNPSSATTATRTDTPLRDIPQSIQVVPRQVLDDRNVQDLTQAIETVAGVVDNGSFYGAPAGARIIRGFGQNGNFRNGFRDVNYFGLTPIGTVEQVEVLRGPASVLFGALEPGGIVNVITRQPLEEPYYNFNFEAGNYGFYQPSIDLSGPLTGDSSLLYRFIASYQSAESFQDFVNSDAVTIAPSLTWNIGSRTNLNLYYEYARYFADPPVGEVPLFRDNDFPSRDFYPAYPFFSVEFITHRFGYNLEHEINEDWRVRNNLAAALSRNIRLENTALGREDERFLTDFEAYESDYRINNYFTQVDLLGEFSTGSIEHQILVGFDFNHFMADFEASNNVNSGLPPLNILNPDYDATRPEVFPLIRTENPVLSYGVYLQDQVDLTDNLILLIGGRYDWISYENEIDDFGTAGNTTNEPVQSDGAFSPRIGIVYQPSEIISLYTSYSRSFSQAIGFNPDGEAFEPTRGTQYEVGVRTDFLNGRLSANLAAYYLTKTNITTPDPDNPDFSIQVGEQRSQGIELDIAGEILPGWNVIVAYAYTDAEVTEDNVVPAGNRLLNVPEHQASLWTTYTIQEGDLRGLGFGLGLFYVDERQVDLMIPGVVVPDYLRTDAAIYYRRGRLNTAINIRNLFDIDYASFSNGGRTFIQRGAPFTIIGSVSWEF